MAAPLLEVEASKPATARSRCCGASRSRRGAAISPPSSAPTAPARPRRLRAVAGTIAPWRGRVTFEGEDVTRLPTHAKAARGFALVPEGRQLFCAMTSPKIWKWARSPSARRANMPTGSTDLHAVSAACRRRAAAGRHAFRRRAADGGDRARPDVRSRHPDHRRTVARACAGRRLSAVQRRSSAQGSGLTFCWSSRTCISRSRVSDYAYVLAEGRLFMEGLPAKLLREAGNPAGVFGAVTYAVQQAV